MSYDLVVVVPGPGASDSEIRRRALSLYEADDQGRSPEGPVGDLVVELVRRWPPLHALEEYAQLDASPWSTGITNDRPGRDHDRRLLASG